MPQMSIYSYAEGQYIAVFLFTASHAEASRRMRVLLLLMAGLSAFGVIVCGLHRLVVSWVVPTPCICIVFMGLGGIAGNGMSQTQHYGKTSFPPRMGGRSPH